MIEQLTPIPDAVLDMIAPVDQEQKDIETDKVERLIREELDDTE